jgi:hypothetical protein
MLVYYIMYLFHITIQKYIKNILLDGELKSSKLTNNINEGEGIYKSQQQQFIFFSVTNNKNDINNLIGQVILLFDYKLLINRSFYVSTIHSGSPENLAKWNKGEDYKLKYPKYYKNTEKVLKKLYDQSKLRDPKYFQIYQQVAIKNKVSLKYLKYIVFKFEPSKNILNILKNDYPDVKIIIL